MTFQRQNVSIDLIFKCSGRSPIRRHLNITSSARQNNIKSIERILHDLVSATAEKEKRCKKYEKWNFRKNSFQITYIFINILPIPQKTFFPREIKRFAQLFFAFGHFPLYAKWYSERLKFFLFFFLYKHNDGSAKLCRNSKGTSDFV